MIALGSVEGEFAVSATDNKKLMENIYAGSANRDGALFIQSLADDVTWCVTGQNKWSRTFVGKQSVLNDLQGYFQSLLVQRSRTIAHRFIADGDYVVVEARGDNLTKSGVRYNNEYCMVFRLTNGKIVEIREYCDSALVERALGEFPVSRIRTAV
jgi:ketosteroid isomerase-like protein